MSKYKITYDERGPDLQFGNMEIAKDPRNSDRIEIYILDAHDERIEGGTFSLNDFMSVVRKFYNDNY